MRRRPDDGDPNDSPFEQHTTQKYISIVRTATVKYVEEEIDAGRMMLGGDGKFVELDEAVMTEEKNKRGRRAKKKKWVFGLTDVDGRKVEVNDGKVMRLLRRKEDRRADMARRRKERARPKAVRTRGGGRKRARTTVRALPEVATAPVDPVVDDETLIELPPDDDQTVDEPSEWSDDDFPVLEKELFSQEKGYAPRKALFFYVPDRKKRTLRPIIDKFVAPNSVVMTDEWKGYSGLAPKHQHYTICHKERFSRYVFEGNHGVPFYL